MRQEIAERNLQEQTRFTASKLSKVRHGYRNKCNKDGRKDRAEKGNNNMKHRKCVDVLIDANKN